MQPLGDPRTRRAVATRDEAPLRLELDITDPATFISRYSKNRGDTYNIIDRPAVVAIVRGGRYLIFDAELVGITDVGGLTTIGINGEPCDLDEAVLVGTELCRLVGIPTSKIEAWGKIADSRPAHERVCLQTGKNKFGSHAVTIRTSYGDGPGWRVLYELSLEKGVGLRNSIQEEDK